MQKGAGQLAFHAPGCAGDENDTAVDAHGFTSGQAGEKTWQKPAQNYRRDGHWSSIFS